MKELFKTGVDIQMITLTEHLHSTKYVPTILHTNQGDKGKDNGQLKYFMFLRSYRELRDKTLEIRISCFHKTKV